MKISLILLSTFLIAPPSFALSNELLDESGRRDTSAEVRSPDAVAILGLDYRIDDCAKFLVRQLLSGTSITPTSFDIDFVWLTLGPKTYYRVKIKDAANAEYNGYIYAHLVDARDSRGELKGLYCQLKRIHRPFSLRNSAGREIISLDSPYPIDSFGGYGAITIRLTREFSGW